MPGKDFNVAHLWGKILSMKSERSKNKVPFVEVRLGCPSEKYGEVLVHVRFWGLKRSNEVLECSSKDTVNITGIMEQYPGKKDGEIRTNFTGFKIQSWNPSETRHKTKRAVFLMGGTVTELTPADGGVDLHLSVHVNGTGEFPDRDEPFVVFLPDEVTLEHHSPEVGQKVKVKGAIKREENEYGETERYSEPVVEVTEKVKEDTSPQASQPEEEEVKEEDVPF